MNTQPTLSRRLVAEALGTMLLIIAVVGSGIMATNLSTDVGIQLLANAGATAAALIALILMFADISGAHFNPVVTVAARVLSSFPSRDIAPYIVAQTIGGCIGAVIANLMFDLNAVTLSTKIRTGGNIWLSEVVATMGLLLVIFLISRSKRASAVPYAVGLWIGGAYWFTSSTSLANPAVSIARSLTDTFAGIAPRSVPMFVMMQLVGLVVALPIIKFIAPQSSSNE
ncbi:MAG: aquaporin family protein [Acidimicrobiaceae bacterium]|nr:aquaporin family protein [Acidimicrobiaceae bacterium]